MVVQRARMILGKRITAGVVFVCTIALATPHPSYAGSARSSAGGGDVSSMDWGKVGTSVGISIGGAVVGSVIGGAFQSAQSTSTATSNIGKGLDATGKMLSSTSPWVSSVSSITASGVLTTMGYGYNAYMAGTQVGRAIGAAGQYYDWGNGTTYLLASIGSSAAGGFLNPSASLGDTSTLSSSTSSFFSSAAHPMLSGALVGAAGGAAYGAAALAIDGDKIRAGKDPGTAALVAGTAASLGATILTRTALDYRTYTVQDKNYKVIDEGGTKYVVTKDGFKVPEAEFRQTGLDKFQYKISDKTYGGPLENTGIGRGTEATYGDVGTLMQGSNVGQGDTTTAYQNAQTYLDNNGYSVDYAKMTPGETVDYARANGFTGDKTQVVHFGGKNPMDVTLDNQQVRFLENTRYGTQPNSFNAPEVKFNADGGWDFVKPTAGQVAGRLTAGVIAETVNQWPSVAATGLALMATESLDKNWKPFVYGMVNTVSSSALDGLANTYSLKPSLIGSLNNNIDTKLGYFPELKYQQQQLFLRTAMSGTISNAIKDKQIDGLLDPKVKYLVTDAEVKSALSGKGYSLDDLNGMSKQQLEELMRSNLASDQKFAQGKLVTAADVLPDTLKLSQTQKDLILADFVGNRNRSLDPTQGKGMKFDDAIAKSLIYSKVKSAIDSQRLDYRDMTTVEMRNNLGKEYTLKNADGTYTVGDEAVKSLAAQSFPGKTGLDILKEAGGSRLTTMGMIGSNILRSDLPVSALAGLINVGFNEGIKAAAGVNATTDDTQLAALTGVAAASIARGTVGWATRYYSQKRELESIQAGKFDPEMASWRTVQGNADIYQARIRGDIPIPETYSVTGKFYEDNLGNRLPVEDVQAKVDSIRTRLGELGVQVPQYDVTKTDLDTIRRSIDDEINRRNRSVTGSDTEFLAKLEDSSIRQDLAAIGTKVQDYMTIEKGAIPGKQQVLYKPTTITIDNIYALKPQGGDVQVFDRLDRQTENGVLSKDTYYSVYNGELTEKSKFSLDGKRLENAEVYPLAAVPSLGNTIFGNLRQGMYEMGWQTMAMGLPHSQGGKLSAYAWNSYRQNLVSNINSARYRGFFATMQLNSIDVMKGTETSSSGIIENFGLYTLANTPAGDWMKLSRYVPVSGYKGLPYSEAYVSEVGLNSANVVFYPNFPYYSTRVVPVDPFARYLRNMRASSINPNDQIIAPGGEGPTVKPR